MNKEDKKRMEAAAADAAALLRKLRGDRSIYAVSKATGLRQETIKKLEVAEGSMKSYTYLKEHYVERLTE